MARIVTFSGSVRLNSVNTALVNSASALVEAAGHEVDAINLGAAQLPVYDGDVQNTHGIPMAAEAMATRIANADGLLIASPEYNGGPSPLLKNTIDWVTRVEMTLFADKPIGLLAASPGGGGGAHGLGILTQIFTYMRCTLHEEPFTLPKAFDAITDGAVGGDDAARLSTWVDGYLSAF